MMNDIILFSPKLYQHRRAGYPPLGVLCVASPLVNEGYKVKIIDQVTDPDWKNTLKNELKGSVKCVGISSMTGYQIKGGLECSKIVKENSNIPVVWGGTHASCLPEQTLNHPLVDIVVKEEGEFTFLELIRALEKNISLKKIRGLWFKDGDKIIKNFDRELINLDDLPEIPYHLIDIEKYIQKDSVIGRDRCFDLCTSRGCPHRCNFCYKFSKQKWRTMSNKKIFNFIKTVINKFKINGINWREDNFFVNKKRVEAISNYIIDEGFDIKWHGNCRADYFSKYESKFIKLLKKSGCNSLTFGMESGSQRVLDCIHKDITVDDILITNRKLKEHSIEGNYHWVMGGINETKEDIFETVKIVKQLLKENPKIRIWEPATYTPYPGTLFYNQSIEKGFKPPKNLEDWMDYNNLNNENLPWLNKGYIKFLKKVKFIFHNQNRYNILWKSWFKARLNLLNKGIVGPIPEKKFKDFAKFIIRKT